MFMKNLIIRHFPMIKLKAPKLLITVFIMISGLGLYAQNTAGRMDLSFSVYTNPLFLTLLTIIILLLIVIIVLGSVLTNVAEATISGKATKAITSILILGCMLSSEEVLAQAPANAVSGTIPSLSSGLFYLLLSVIGFEMLIIIVLLNAIQLFIKKEKRISSKKQATPLAFLERLNASVTIEKEEEILFDHVYDGIRELDNDLPPWWKYGFYLTIVFAVSYLIHYHVTTTGDLQIAEYNKSMIMAKIAKEEFEKNNANNVNESNAVMLADKAEIAKGEAIFKESCFACHGKFGEGGVGPNLTDDYWLHGGGIKEVFASIKYGWPDKGMKAWQSDFSPVQIHQIASYIKTLRGTHPANAKEKQGDLYVEAGNVITDSTEKDSIPLIIKDTLN
jgi:cytochrome c oxidase cbb3-type subunit III